VQVNLIKNQNQLVKIQMSCTWRASTPSFCGQRSGLYHKDSPQKYQLIHNAHTSSLREIFTTTQWHACVSITTPNEQLNHGENANPFSAEAGRACDELAFGLPACLPA
jgi:hypothetical protein